MPYGGWIAPSSDTVWPLPPYDVVIGTSWCEGHHGRIKIEWFDDSIYEDKWRSYGTVPDRASTEIRRRFLKDRMK